MFMNSKGKCVKCSENGLFLDVIKILIINLGYLWLFLALCNNYKILGN